MRQELLRLVASELSSLSKMILTKKYLIRFSLLKSRQQNAAKFALLQGMQELFSFELLLKLIISGSQRDTLIQLLSCHTVTLKHSKFYANLTINN